MDNEVFVTTEAQCHHEKKKKLGSSLADWLIQQNNKCTVCDPPVSHVLCILEPVLSSPHPYNTLITKDAVPTNTYIYGCSASPTQRSRRAAHFMQAKSQFNIRPHASNYHLQETNFQFPITDSSPPIPIIFTTVLCTCMRRITTFRSTTTDIRVVP